MSPSIPNNVLPLIPKMSETLPEPDSLPGFDLQLRREVARAQPADRTATSDRDEQVASNSSGADREDVNKNVEVGESEVHESQPADPPLEEETRDLVELSESGQAVADTQQTTIDVEVIEQRVLITNDAEQPEAASPTVVKPADEETTEGINTNSIDVEETLSPLNGVKAVSDSLTEQGQDTPTTTKLFRVESTLKTEADIPIDSAPSSDKPLAEATNIKPSPPVAQATVTTNIEPSGEAAEAAGFSTSDNPEAGPTTSNAGAGGEEEPRERRQPQSRATPSVRPLETSTTESPAPAVLQVAEQSAAPFSVTSGETESVSAEKPVPTFSLITGQRAAIEQTSPAATQESQPTDGPRVDSSRFVNRVARAFQAAEQRGGSVQLRLSPPELGAMKIELSVQQGALTAKLEAETAAAKNLLLDNLPALRERLAAQEIRVEKFEVDVRQQGSGSEPDWQARQEKQEEGLSRKRPSDEVERNHDSTTSRDDEKETVARPHGWTQDGSLNVVA